MTEKEFLRTFKRHLEILKKRITKKRVLTNLKYAGCPFKLQYWDTALWSRSLGINGRKIVSGENADQAFKETANAYAMHYTEVLPQMMKIVKKTKWRGKKFYN